MTSFSAETKTDAKAIKLLTIGNSFAEDATYYLSELAAAAGHELILGKANIGGCSMEKHWNLAKASEMDPADSQNKPYEGKSLQEKISEKKWDYVTIQQASILSHDPSTFHPYVDQLIEYIKKHAPQAEILLHEIWAYRSDDPQFNGRTAGSTFPSSSEDMQDRIKTTYRTIAKEWGLRMIPVGDAFQMALSDPKGKFVPDPNFKPETAKEPELPDQKNSLHTGWTWVKEKDDSKLIMDYHPSKCGKYLGACVFFEFLFKEPVTGNSFIPESIEKDRAHFLQTMAHKAIEGSK